MVSVIWLCDLTHLSSSPSDMRSVTVAGCQQSTQELKAVAQMSDEIISASVIILSYIHMTPIQKYEHEIFCMEYSKK